MNKANIKHNAKDFRQIMYIFSGVLANQAAASLNKCKLDLNSMMKGTFSQYFSPFFCHMLKRDSKNYHPSTFCETEQHDHSIKYLLLCSLEDIHVWWQRQHDDE